MAAPDTINQSLIQAACSKDQGLLRSAFHSITASGAGAQHSLEALVTCAETSLDLGDTSIARSCLDVYFAEARRCDMAICS